MFFTIWTIFIIKKPFHDNKKKRKALIDDVIFIPESSTKIEQPPEEVTKI